MDVGLIGYGILIIYLIIRCAILHARIEKLELISRKHDEGIQDLYTRKANRQPVIETMIPPDMDKEAAKEMIEKYLSMYNVHKK